MKTVLAICAAACALSPLAARSQFIDGNELLEVCGQPASGWYVMGVADATFFEAFRDDEKLQHCPGPKGVKSSQYRDIVCNYLRDNPAKRNLTASQLSVMALQESFGDPRIGCN